MQFFINETSLHGQYDNLSNFFSAVKVFLSSIKKISEIKNEKNVFKSNYFFYYSGIEGILLGSSIKYNPALNRAFIENLDKLNPKIWQKNQLHNTSCSYYYSGENFVCTSIAEISERRLVVENFCGFLLNFSQSKFGSATRLTILKNNIEPIEVDAVITPEQIEKWLIDKGLINPEEVYDEKSGIAPTDLQTVLRDSTIFEKTSYPRNNGRVVYRRKDTSELWVVESSTRHAGAKAHIEIFDEITRKHLGTSLYNEINLNKLHRRKDREINLG